MRNGSRLRRLRPIRKLGYLRQAAAAGRAVAIDRHGSLLAIPNLKPETLKPETKKP